MVLPGLELRWGPQGWVQDPCPKGPQPLSLESGSEGPSTLGTGSGRATPSQIDDEVQQRLLTVPAVDTGPSQLTGGRISRDTPGPSSLLGSVHVPVVHGARPSWLRMSPTGKRGLGSAPRSHHREASRSPVLPQQMSSGVWAMRLCTVQVTRASHPAVCTRLLVHAFGEHFLALC